MAVNLFVVSDALGETAEGVARAVLAQFEGVPYRVRKLSHVDHEAALLGCLRVVEAAPSPVVVYTLVVEGFRARMAEELALRNIPGVDVLGPVLEAVEHVAGQCAVHTPGSIHRLDEGYFQRVEAVEFAVRYDDGKDPRGLSLADVVLLGVSRTSKTPLSMYLAHHRVKVANVPLVPEAPLPEELFRVPRERLLGLTIDPESLRGIRRTRLETIGLPDGAPYASLQRIERELDYAKDVFRRLGCRVVDVSRRAVEETAERVMRLIPQGRADYGELEPEES